MGGAKRLEATQLHHRLCEDPAEERVAGPLEAREGPAGVGQVLRAHSAFAFGRKAVTVRQL